MNVFATRLLCLPVLLLILRPVTAADGLNVPRTAARLAAGEQVKIVCFGDSVTGIYYHTGGRRAYPEMLSLALERVYGKGRPTIINAGISGNDTRAALARIEKDVLKHKPQLVTVMFGLNDVVRVPPDQFAVNLGTIIQKCRGVGAEVMLCTPNGVYESAQRPILRIADYLAVIKRVGQEQKVPIADCWQAYDSVRKAEQGALDFAFLMSDEIHPNMSGHKLTAETIAHAISGKKVSLSDVGPLFPSIPRTRAALKSGGRLTVLAMPPFDSLIEPSLKRENPDLQLEIIPWPTAGKSLVELERDAKKVRDKKIGLVLIAIPSSATAPSEKEYQRAYTWVLNSSLSFGLQQWDCVAIPASVFEKQLSPEERSRDATARKLIMAQDLGMIDRKSGDKSPIETLLAIWLREQMR